MAIEEATKEFKGMTGQELKDQIILLTVKSSECETPIEVLKSTVKLVAIDRVAEGEIND